MRGNAKAEKLLPYSYQKAEPGVWEVGRFRNDGVWEQESRWATQEEAAEHAHTRNAAGSAMPHGDF